MGGRASSKEPLQQPSFPNYNALYRTYQGPQNTNDRSVNRAPVCSVSTLNVSHTRMSSDLPGWRVTHDDSSSGTSPPNTELPPHHPHILCSNPSQPPFPDQLSSSLNLPHFTTVRNDLTWYCVHFSSKRVQCCITLLYMRYLVNSMHFPHINNC